MKKTVKSITKNVLRRAGVGVMGTQYLDDLLKWRDSSVAESDVRFLLDLPPGQGGKLLDYRRKSTSQICQDLFVLSELDFMRGGFFVEFGATNGYALSNTHILETEFGWRGILAEPAIRWHDELRRNRQCAIETKCVWTGTGDKLTFNETEIGEYSTIAAFNSVDWHGADRTRGKSYEVETISLSDMLRKHRAPRHVDYLSIDTEGSELAILQAFDFDEYEIKIVTCEHNYTPARQGIFELLSAKGFVRKYENHSQFDDWYVKS